MTLSKFQTLLYHIRVVGVRSVFIAARVYRLLQLLVRKPPSCDLMWEFLKPDVRDAYVTKQFYLVFGRAQLRY